MSVIRWMRGKLASRPSTDDKTEKYDAAIALTDEVIDQFRERAASPDPFRAMMADMFLQHHDIGLLSEVYEAVQEAKIFKGPSDNEN